MFGGFDSPTSLWVVSIISIERISSPARSLHGTHWGEFWTWRSWAWQWISHFGFIEVGRWQGLMSKKTLGEEYRSISPQSAFMSLGAWFNMGQISIINNGLNWCRPDMDYHHIVGEAWWSHMNSLLGGNPNWRNSKKELMYCNIQMFTLQVSDMEMRICVYLYFLFGAAESPSLGIDTLILDVNKLLDYSMLRRSNLSLVGVLLTKT